MGNAESAVHNDLVIPTNESLYTKLLKNYNTSIIKDYRPIIDYQIAQNISSNSRKNNNASDNDGYKEMPQDYVLCKFIRSFLLKPDSKLKDLGPAFVCCPSIPIFGNSQNHFPFLEPSIFPYFFPYLVNETLLTCLTVCPHWFVSIYSYMRQIVQPVLDAFKVLQNYLEYRTSTISIQPLFTADMSYVRIDLIIYARILPLCVNKCVQVGYAYRYLHDSQKHQTNLLCENDSTKCMDSSRMLTSYDNTEFQANVLDSYSSTIIPPSNSSFGHNAKKRYHGIFRFETQKQHSRRTVWLQKDLCRFHGDELMIASVANVPVLNVYDWVEIPVNIANAFGIIDTTSLFWLPVKSIEGTERMFGQHCEQVSRSCQWLDLESYQHTSTERLQTYDHFGPQWQHIKTEFTGLDVTLSRSTYIANKIGNAPQSKEWLGIKGVVRTANSPIVCPLSRLGLQHDRFTSLELRQNDTVILYIRKGGGSII